DLLANQLCRPVRPVGHPGRVGLQHSCCRILDSEPDWPVHKLATCLIEQALPELVMRTRVGIGDLERDLAELARRKTDQASRGKRGNRRPVSGAGRDASAEPPPFAGVVVLLLETVADRTDMDPLRESAAAAVVARGGCPRPQELVGD